jgi:hypothetical protein
VRILLLAALLSATTLAHAQGLSKALVVPTCQIPREVEEGGSALQQLTMDPQGRLCAAPGNAGSQNMTTPIMWYNASPAGNLVFYAPVLGGPWNGSVTFRQSVTPIDGVVANFIAFLPVAVTTNYYTFSLNVNGTSTLLQCSVGQGGVNLGTTTECSDTVDQIAVHPGDLLSIESSIPGGTPSTVGGLSTMAMTLTSTNGQESLVGGAPNPYLSTTAIQYIGFTGNAAQITDALASSIMPTAGKLDHLYVVSNLAQAVGASVQYTVFKNGVPTAIVTTCTNAAAVCTDLVDAITIVAGDTISIQICPGGVAGCQAGAATATRTMNFSLRFTPATPDQAMVFSTPVGLPAPAVAVRIGALVNAVNTVNTNDITYQNISPPVSMTLGDLIVGQCPGPDVAGAGAVTRTQTLRANSAFQAPVVAIVGNSAAPCPTLEIGQDTTHTYQTGPGDTLSLGVTMNTITNAAALGELKYSMTVVMPPP